MKKLFLLSLVALLTLSVSAQGIFFEENEDLNVALEKAKAENKLVFIDAYAEWCGPCKVMARAIFPQAEVGEFFNEHFVNLKLDMEKPNNTYIAKKYEVRAYPTYLFLDSEGELVHKSLGSMPADKFIEVAKTATDSENNFMALNKKIEKGDRSLATINSYISQNPYSDNIDGLLDDYFGGISDEEILTEENWELFNKHVSNYESAIFKRFLNNRGEVANFVGHEKVTNKITSVIAQAYYRNPDKAEELKKIDSEIFESAKTQVDMSRTYSAFMRNKEDKTAWDSFAKALTPFVEKESSPEALNQYAWLVFENYKKFEDVAMLKNALSWAEKATKLAPENDAILDTYANLLFASGKKKAAIKNAQKALKIATGKDDKKAIETYTNVIAGFKKKKK